MASFFTKRLALGSTSGETEVVSKSCFGQHTIFQLWLSSKHAFFTGFLDLLIFRISGFLGFPEIPKSGFRKSGILEIPKSGLFRNHLIFRNPKIRDFPQPCDFRSGVMEPVIPSGAWPPCYRTGPLNLTEVLVGARLLSEEAGIPPNITHVDRNLTHRPSDDLAGTIF